MADSRDACPSLTGLRCDERVEVKGLRLPALLARNELATECVQLRLSLLQNTKSGLDDLARRPIATRGHLTGNEIRVVVVQADGDVLSHGPKVPTLGIPLGAINSGVKPVPLSRARSGFPLANCQKFAKTRPLSEYPDSVTQPSPTPPTGAVCWSDPITIDDQTTIVHATREARNGRMVPVGTLTVSGGSSTWTPAYDVTLIALGGICVGLAAAAMGGLAIVRRPPWQQITPTS